MTVTIRSGEKHMTVTNAKLYEILTYFESEVKEYEWEAEHATKDINHHYFIGCNVSFGVAAQMLRRVLEEDENE